MRAPQGDVLEEGPRPAPLDECLDLLGENVGRQPVERQGEREPATPAQEGHRGWRSGAFWRSSSSPAIFSRRAAMRLRHLLPAAAALLVLPGCASIGDAVPACKGPGIETTFLMSQAVRAARFVPCSEVMPAGWRIDSLEVKSSGARLSFTLDRGGAAALQVRLDYRCDVSQAESLPSDEPCTRVRGALPPRGALHGQSLLRVRGRVCDVRVQSPPGGIYTAALSDIFMALTFQERVELQRAHRDGFEAHT